QSLLPFFFQSSVPSPFLHSFPTRRSSDLILFIGLPAVLSGALFLSSGSTPQIPKENLLPVLARFLPFMPAWKIFTDVSIISLLADRKSTRLNSSHRTISYAVFCLKKKKR